MLDILQRSVKKEADACIDVFESFKKSGVGDVWRFGLRMVVDGVVSCRVVGSRAAEGLRKGWESIVDRGGSGDEGG